jgi:hypothetical protein
MLVIGGGINMDHWCNDTYREKPRNMLQYHFKLKVKQSCYRPGVAQRVPGS